MLVSSKTMGFGDVQILKDELGSRSVDDVNYNEANMIHIINKGSLHFEPLLNKRKERSRSGNTNANSTLGVKRNSSRKLAVELHPDKGPNNPKAKERFEELSKEHKIKKRNNSKQNNPLTGCFSQLFSKLKKMFSRHDEGYKRI